MKFPKKKIKLKDAKYACIFKILVLCPYMFRMIKK